MKLQAYVKPRSIAVVGASRDPSKVGHKILKNLIDSGFEGNLYPINPKIPSLIGRTSYKTIGEVPDDIDLAIISVPAHIVPEVSEQCGRKGVNGIIVISAGFSETGRDGTILEKRLFEICKKYNMRMQGPNCLGIVNTKSKTTSNFAKTDPKNLINPFISIAHNPSSFIL